MKVGTPLAITIKQNNSEANEKIYRCKLIDIKEDHFIIDYPLSSNPDNPMPIRLNAKVTIDYIDKASVYSFDTVVSEIIEQPLRAIVIPKPNKDDIRKIQRREFVRIDTDVDVAVYSERDTFSPFTTVTQDISGGGACIILSKHQQLEDDELLKLYLVLRSPYSDYEFVEVPAEVVRTSTRNEVQTASLRFVFDDNRKQQKIIKYCFEVQRQAIKQNMMLQ